MMFPSRHFADAFHAGIFKEVGNIGLPPGRRSSRSPNQTSLQRENKNVHSGNGSKNQDR